MFVDIIGQGPIVERALIFAAAAHAAVGQKRKYTHEDYIHHPVDVCRILIGRGILDQEMLAAALLHDVVEDTMVTFDQLSQMFGSSVVELVKGLTDVSVPEDGNRSVRKAKDREHTASAGPRVQTIKYADCISNARSIKADDPDFWRLFKHEIKALLDVANEGDAILHRQALYELGMLTDIKVNYTQHIPGWARDAGRDEETPLLTGVVSSVEELLAVEFIGKQIRPGFKQYQIEKTTSWNYALLIATDDDGGAKVVATLTGDYDFLGLDIWMISPPPATLAQYTPYCR